MRYRVAKRIVRDLGRHTKDWRRWPASTLHRAIKRINRGLRFGHRLWIQDGWLIYMPPPDVIFVHPEAADEVRELLK